MNQRSLMSRLATFLGICVSIGRWPACAQTTAQSSRQLEEVVVTARKTEESLQNVPVAVAVISQEQLQNNNCE